MKHFAPFLLLCLLAANCFAAATVTNNGVSNVTRIAATAYCTVSTNADPIEALYIGWGTTDPQSLFLSNWQNYASITWSTNMHGVTNCVLTNLVPASQYYCEFEAVTWADVKVYSGVISWWTEAGAPTNDDVTPLGQPWATISNLTASITILSNQVNALSIAFSNRLALCAYTNEYNEFYSGTRFHDTVHIAVGNATNFLSLWSGSYNTCWVSNGPSSEVHFYNSIYGVDELYWSPMATPSKVFFREVVTNAF